jgi:ribonuclease HII
LKLIAGVDEAGRGSVLGPLVVAGVAIEESMTSKLSELGVKDSKLLAPAKRRKLYTEIKKIATEVSWELIDPREIDKVVFRGIPLLRLNRLEGECMARVLAKLNFDLAYVDCCDTNQRRFGELIAGLMFQRQKAKTKSPIELGEKNPYLTKLRSEHHADRNYAVVSAASIIAKVRRDAYIQRLHRIHGLFGSGYPHDEVTKNFLKGFVERSESLPSITRLSWATVRNLTAPPVSDPPTMERFISEDSEN